MSRRFIVDFPLCIFENILDCLELVAVYPNNMEHLALTRDHQSHLCYSNNCV